MAEKIKLEGAGQGDTPRSVNDRYGENYERIFGKRSARSFQRGRRTFIGKRGPALGNGDNRKVTNIGLGVTPDRVEDVLKIDPQARHDVDFTNPNRPVFETAAAMERHAKKRGYDPACITH